MAVRALKQTGSRNIEAALEYISKMGYLDPRNELIVRVIKQTSPGRRNAFSSIKKLKYTNTGERNNIRVQEEKEKLLGSSEDS